MVRNTPVVALAEQKRMIDIVTALQKVPDVEELGVDASEDDILLRKPAVIMKTPMYLQGLKALPGIRTSHNGNSRKFVSTIPHKPSARPPRPPLNTADVGQILRQQATCPPLGVTRDC